MMFREVMNSYATLDSSVLCPMLDLSKTFDRITFNIMVAQF